MIFLLFFISIQNSFGLIPLESLILGDFSDKYDLEVSDPLHYIYDFTQYAQDGVMDKDKKSLAIYRGFYEEGQNLKDYCASKKEMTKYPTPWDRDQAKRAYMATLQYVGLDLVIRAMVSYAKIFEMSEEEYSNIVSGLVGNYCSANLSIISVKQLEKLMKKRFSQNDFSLPSVEGSPLFPESVNSFQSMESSRKQEFYYTIELFKTFCSWSGGTEDAMLLVPLLRNPVVYSFIERQLLGKRLMYNENTGRIHYADDAQTVQVICQNLICRKTDLKTYSVKVPKSIGFSNIKLELDNLYCEDFVNTDYNFKQKDEKIKKIMDSISFDEQNFMTGQFISLFTGVPDFFLRQKEFKDIELLSRSSIDQYWSLWAKKYTENLGKDMYYEEPLTMELVERTSYYNKYTPKFKVVFDVNLGEMDRINQEVGKVKTYFEISLSHQFAKWIRREWQNHDPRERDIRGQLQTAMRDRLTDTVQKIREKFVFAPWDGDLEKILVNEILDQFAEYEGNYFSKNTTGNMIIPIEVNFAPYALSYMRHNRLILRSKENEKRNNELRQLRQKKKIKDKPPVIDIDADLVPIEEVPENPQNVENL